ncbi:MAG: DUF3696 domain-containing protein [Fimbriimonadaceae bacterium]|nr:DUF3696 domain-containing protein [Fimbriimonadaceae bacterium]
MIRRLQLQRFKCFLDLDLDFAPLTLLAGCNSAGKSTVLQSLALLRQAAEQDGTLACGLPLQGDYVALGDARDVLSDSADEESIRIRLDWGEQQAEWLFGYRPGWSVLTVENPAPPPPLPPCGGDFQYLSADRLRPQVCHLLDDRAIQRRSVGACGEYAAHLLGALGSVHIDGYQPHPASRQLDLNVNQALAELCDGAEVQATVERDRGLVTLRYIQRGPVGVTYRRPQNVGFGLTAVLPVVVAALTTRPGGLLVVENPEAHLHPAAQRRVTAFLAQVAAHGVQVILETHSDHVLNGVRTALVRGDLAESQVACHFFSAPGTVASPRLLADGSIAEPPAGFFDEWELALDEILFGEHR